MLPKFKAQDICRNCLNEKKQKLFPTLMNMCSYVGKGLMLLL